MAKKIPKEDIESKESQSSKDKLLLIVVGVIIVILISAVAYSWIIGNSSNDGGTNLYITPPSETEEEYKDLCRQDITYEQLNSNPYSYSGEHLTYKGEILQVIEGASSTSYRVDIGNNDDIFLTINQKPGVVEGDYVQIWGDVLGAYSYESIAGWTITLPHIQAWYIEKPNLVFNIGESANWMDLNVTVKSVHKSNNYTWIGSSETVYVEEAESGKIFLTIDVEVIYAGTDSEYISGSDFWLIDSEGYKYDYDSGTYSIEGGLESTTLYQNQKVEGNILFEIPESATGLNVQFNFGSSYRPLLAEWNIQL